MKDYILIELLKTKRTIIRKIVFIIPIICAIIAFGICMLCNMPGMSAKIAVNTWGLILLPTLVTLICGLCIKQEKKSSGYKMIFGTSIKPDKVWIGKIISVSIMLFITTIFLFLAITIFQICLNVPLQNFGDIVLALLISWLAILWQVPLYLLLAQKINFFLLLAISFITNTFIGAIVAPKAIWWLVPWSWVLRFQTPIMKIQPNGLQLIENSELSSYADFPKALIIVLVLTLVSCALNVFVFNKKRDECI